MYLYPYEGPANEHRFLCEPGSLNFLVHHGFDFNKWLREGLVAERTELAKDKGC